LPGRSKGSRASSPSSSSADSRPSSATGTGSDRGRIGLAVPVAVLTKRACDERGDSPRMKRRSSNDPKAEAEALPATTEARRSLDTLSEFETKIRKDRSTGERIAGFAINKAGSGTFVGLHAIGFAAWIVTNLGVIKGVEPFDPFPFGLLTVIVSLEAIFLALLLLIAQTRMTKERTSGRSSIFRSTCSPSRRARRHSRCCKGIATHLGLEVENDEEAKQLARKTNVPDG